METTIAEPRKVKHTIYLDPVVSRRLKREKGETDRSISEIVEDSLETRYDSSLRPAMTSRSR